MHNIVGKENKCEFQCADFMCCPFDCFVSQAGPPNIFYSVTGWGDRGEGSKGIFVSEIWSEGIFGGGL